jgi:hypothetical protein
MNSRHQIINADGSKPFKFHTRDMKYIGILKINSTGLNSNPNSSSTNYLAILIIMLFIVFLDGLNNIILHFPGFC